MASMGKSVSLQGGYSAQCIRVRLPAPKTRPGQALSDRVWESKMPKTAQKNGAVITMLKPKKA